MTRPTKSVARRLSGSPPDAGPHPDQALLRAAHHYAHHAAATAPVGPGGLTPCAGSLSGPGGAAVLSGPGEMLTQVSHVYYDRRNRDSGAGSFIPGGGGGAPVDEGATAAAMAAAMAGRRRQHEDAMSLDGGLDGQNVEVPLDDQLQAAAGRGEAGDGPGSGNGADPHGHGDGQDAAAANGGALANGGGGHEADADGDAGPGDGPMTDTIAAGILAVQQRRANIEQQIDELTSSEWARSERAALDYLEAMRKDFLERMARLKAEVGGFCNTQVATWREANATTQEALNRLAAARELVRSLGLNANQPGVDEGAGPGGAGPHGGLLL
ncbi:hypothetical protein HYH03_005158 [Edaphochlamys debaryana]|uniref:Uncharacterized protein n=1 Tax=Edaphochlamys debaryana TaxID=47281 RepID=A0A836C2M1_9CHLO|nr:hypothetical protein HYH03_005158 [Edaphochlamys debaryana]|eukprot:KAG2496749.1 hypothetical protein HYH03_005158 [Edaphochlamys debaryana]